MGDGRYYTQLQFYNVTFLMLLIIFFVISLIAIYYRNTNNKGSKSIIVILAQLLLITTFRCIEEVMYYEHTAMMLRVAQNILLISVCLSIIYYFVNFVLPVNKEKRTAHYWNSFIAIYVLVFILVAIFNEGNSILAEYSFHSVVYKKSFIILLLILVVMLLIFSISMFFINRQSLSLILLSLIVIPLFIYLLKMSNLIFYIDIIDFCIYMMIVIAIDIFAYSFVPYNITPLAFDSIKDLINDYVIIVDGTGKVIYYNDHVKESEILDISTNINIDNIDSIFIGEIDKNCFTYTIKELNSKGKSLGHLITITDISELISMINSLKYKKQKAETLSLELIDYSKVVYYLEKEKKINALIEQIDNKQGNKMKEIIAMINKATIKLADDDSDAEDIIDALIRLSKESLIDVRKVVSIFQDYYGGEKYDQSSIS